jgi:hypothetical protein
MTALLQGAAALAAARKDATRPPSIFNLSDLKPTLAISEVGAEKQLVHLQLAGAGEHFFGGCIPVGLGERGALGPGHKVFERAPPSLDLVVTLRIGVLDPGPGLVIEAHGSRPVHLVADETGRPVDQVHPVLEPIFEVDLVPRGHGDAVGDDDHFLLLWETA